MSKFVSKIVEFLCKADTLNVWLALIAVVLTSAIQLLWPGAIEWAMWPVLLLGFAVWAICNYCWKTPFWRLLWWIGGALLIQLFIWI